MVQTRKRSAIKRMARSPELFEKWYMDQIDSYLLNKYGKRMRDMDADDPFVKLVKRIVRRSVVKAFNTLDSMFPPGGA